MINKKAFSLMEITVVVLIVAILAAIALPKYMISKDKARINSLMVLGKQINNALNRKSAIDTATTSNVLDVLDITFQKADGTGNCDAECRIKVSGKTYQVSTRLNYNGVTGRNYTIFTCVDDTSFAALLVHSTKSAAFFDYKFNLNCFTEYFGNTPDSDRCRKIARSFGSVCADTDGVCYW